VTGEGAQVPSWAVRVSPTLAVPVMVGAGAVRVPAATVAALVRVVEA
jgi:hypothetical protein